MFSNRRSHRRHITIRHREKLLKKRRQIVSNLFEKLNKVVIGVKRKVKKVFFFKYVSF
jgi:hypothetical protein